MRIPQSSKAPNWVQKFSFAFQPVQYLDHALSQNLDLFSAPIMGNNKNVLLVSHPNIFQKIFVNETKEFYSPSNANLRPLMGNYSLFALEELPHQKQRKLLLPPFHRERIYLYGKSIQNLTKKCLQDIHIASKFQARVLMQSISLEVILKTVFGLNQEEKFDYLKQLIVQLMDLFESPLTSASLYFTFLQKEWLGLSPWNRFVKIKQKINFFIEQEIEARRQQLDSNSQDILSLLLSVRDSENQPMTNEELRDQLITLLFAGHETTATAIAWGLYWIHRQPEIKNNLLQELASLGYSATPTELYNLPYLTAICQESLRIYPVGILTMPRQVKKPVKLLNFEVEKDTIIYGSIYSLHHREDLYPEPNKFRPERFLERKFTPYEFIPFGGGDRRCIGENLALWEMKIVLATIMQNAELSLANQLPEIPQRRGVTLAPKSGVEMILHRVNSD